MFADTCLCLAVRKAARAVSRHYDEALHCSGINNGQFSVLMIVSAARATTVGLLADELAIDRTTATAVLKPLLRDRLVALEVNPDDARSRLVTITARGRERLAQAIPLWRKAQGALERKLSPTEPGAARQLLREFA